MLTHFTSGFAALTVAAGAAVAVPTLMENAAASEVPTITTVAYTDLGGGYSPYVYSAGCDGLTLTVTDSTPSEVFDYSLKIDGQDVPVLDLQTQEDGSLSMLTVCPAGLAPDLNYPIVVGEAGVEGEPYTWTLEQVNGPTTATPTLPMIAGREGRVTLDGAWELGTEVETKVVASEGATREEARNTASSELAIPSAYDASTGVVSFTIPVAATGRYLWVSAKGSRSGMASAGVFVEPLKVSPPPQPAAFPSAWVKSPGAKRGVVKVGRTVKVTVPVYSSPSVAKLVTAKYQWKANGKAIKGAKARSYRIARAHAGKRLTVAVTFTANGYKPLVKTVGFGRVRR